MYDLLCLLSLAVAPPPGIDDVHDLVLLHPLRPYRIRFHLRLNGRSFQSGWRQQMDRLFTFLDSDGDGRLSPAEGGRALSREQWRQLSRGQATLDPDPAPDFLELARGKKSATRDDFQAFYAVSTAGPLQPAYSWRQSPADPLSDRLWQKLGRREGRLSRRELSGARDVLTRLDSDDDELLSPDELMGEGFADSPPAFHAGPAHGPAPGGLPFFSLRPGGSLAGLTDWLDRRPGSAAAWRDGPPDLELLVPLEGPDHPIRVLSGPAPGLDFRVTSRGEALVADGWRIELNRPRPQQPRSQPAAPSPSEQNVFQSLDRDRNGFLDGKEIYQPPFHHVAWLRLADRDGDGKLTRKEFATFAEFHTRLHGQVTFLHVESLGRSLYRLLDQDGDGRLGPRELLEAQDRVAAYDRGTGVVTRDGLPQHYRLSVGHGSAGGPTIRGRVPRGPVWFRKMDSNGDGDVSLREWLGTREQFRRLDSNGDGLIGVDEARRGPRE